MNFNIRSVIMIVVALGVAGFTAFLARGWLSSNAPRAPQIHAAAPAAPATEVLVAKMNIPTGTIIKQDQLAWQAWPGKPSDAYVVKGQRSMDAYVGAVARQSMAAGEPVSDVRVVKPGEQGFMAAVLTPGMRAMTVSINATSAVAGFVFPGDRVDLLLSHRVKTGSGRRVVSETVLTNVRVLAIDQKTNDMNKGPAALGKTATLEVTPKQVEKINVARQLGGLSLSLRPLANTDQNLVADGAGLVEDPKPRTGTTHTWDSEVSRLLPAPNPSGDTQTVKLSRGDKTASFNFRRTGK
jgi:pilus assembly protein CpaB